MGSGGDTDRPTTKPRSTMWIIPSTVSAFVRAQECSISESSSPSSISDREPVLWVTVNGKAAQRPCSWPGWKKRAWSQRLFGAVNWNTSRANCLLEKWLQELPGSLALPFRAQENNLGRRMSDGYCPPYSSVFAKQDANGCFLKTSEGCFLQMMGMPSEKFSGSWPSSGSMLNGRCFQVERWGPAWKELASSSWPTARAEDAESCGNHPGASDSLTGVAKNWPTPRCNTGPDSSERHASLCGISRTWPTPKAGDDGTTGTQSKMNPKAGRQLREEARNWPTPASRDYKGDYSDEAMIRKDGKTRDDLLPNVASRWTTPTAHDVAERGSGQKPCAKAGNACLPQGCENMGNQEQLEFSRPVLHPSNGNQYSKTSRTLRRRLNPVFVSWLMGWPIWWTHPEPINCARREMELWRSKLLQRLSIFFGGS